MHLGNIPFCGKIVHNIKDDLSKEVLLKKLDQDFNLRILEKQHENYKAALIERLQKEPHYISIKSVGSPYYLFLTQYEDQNVCIFIDKKIQHGYLYPRMIVVNLEFDNDGLFANGEGRGVVFDGEMISTEKRWVFLIGDMYVDRVREIDDPAKVRLEFLTKLWASLFKPRPKEDVCSFEIKRFFTYQDLPENLENFIDSLPYKVRGIYFKPVNTSLIPDVLYMFEQPQIHQKPSKPNHYSHDSCNPEFFRHLPIADTPRPLTESEAAILKKKTRTDSIEISPMNRIKAKFEETSKFQKDLHAHEDQGVPTVNLPGVVHWWTRKTPYPSIYELYDDNNIALNRESPSFVGHMHIASIDVERYMREKFKNCDMFQRKYLPYQWNKHFHKWQPVII